jgi:two-component system phosphate regulon sensor histidine kinase PhoR
MIKKRRWLWVILFIVAALLLSILATGWNVVLVRDYQHILSLARSLSIPNQVNLPQTQWVLILKMIVGTSGFIAVLALTISLFIKLLSEMRLNQIQSEFLAAVSHELKTPIAAMELCSTLLRSDDLPKLEVERLWDSHQSELKRLKEEVNALLEAARLQARPMWSNRNPIVLETWIQQNVSHWKTILGPEATLSREGEPLDFELRLDPRALNLIFDNIMSNARKYARPVPHVVVRTGLTSESGIFAKAKWQIQVIDSGWGFDPADSKKIFHRFFRAKTTAPYAIPGTGLGLYLAYTASRTMKLKLRGESKGSERGAIFTLEGAVKE